MLRSNYFGLFIAALFFFLMPNIIYAYTYTIKGRGEYTSVYRSSNGTYMWYYSQVDETLEAMPASFTKEYLGLTERYSIPNVDIYYCRDNGDGTVQAGSSYMFSGYATAGFDKSLTELPVYTDDEWTSIGSTVCGCPDGQEYNADAGQCVPICGSEEELNPITLKCGPVCESGEYSAFTGACVPQCPYAMGYIPGEFYGSDDGSLCVAPECGEGEIIGTNGACEPNCPEDNILSSFTGECELHCDAGEEEVNGKCDQKCPAGTTRDPNDPNICRGDTPDELGDPEWLPSDGDSENKPDTAKPSDKDGVEDEGNENDPSDGQLAAINQNLGTIIQQNNDSISKLYDIGDNTKWIGENQAKTVNNLYAINENIKSLGEDIAAGVASGVKNATEGLKDGLSDVEGAVGKVNNTLESMSYTGEQPGNVEYSSDISGEADYSQYDDMTSRVDGYITDDQTFLNEQIASNQSPFNYSITASSSKCVTGTLMNKEVSACFDEPWMETAYSIMKTILIFMGYIQSAMLINRGIGG